MSSHGMLMEAMLCASHLAKPLEPLLACPTNAWLKALGPRARSLSMNNHKNYTQYAERLSTAQEQAACRLASKAAT